MNENNNIKSIKFLTAFPKRKNRWKYYLNNNLQNSYYLKTNDLKNFINKLVKNNLSFELHQCFIKFQPFIIDVENLKILEITPNLEASNKKYVDNFWKEETNIKKCFIKYQKTLQEKNKNKYEIPYS